MEKPALVGEPVFTIMSNLPSNPSYGLPNQVGDSLEILHIACDECAAGENGGRCNPGQGPSLPGGVCTRRG
jgi:hypothetical protein